MISKLILISQVHGFESVSIDFSITFCISQKAFDFLRDLRMQLLLSGAVFRVLNVESHQICTTLATQLLPVQCLVVSRVSSEIFDLFMLILQDKGTEVTKTNFKEL
jgi:hypothetical protein